MNNIHNRYVSQFVKCEIDKVSAPKQKWFIGGNLYRKI